MNTTVSSSPVSGGRTRHLATGISRFVVTGSLVLLACDGLTADSDDPFQARTYELSPILAIGDGDGQVFHNVVSVQFTPSGGVVTADWGSNTVRVFGSDGSIRATAGGSGRGPGEFQSLAAARVIDGDIVRAIDLGVGRITTFGQDGRVLKTSDFGVGPRSTGFGGATESAIITLVIRNRPAVDGLVIEQVDLHHWSTTGEYIGGLGSISGRWLYAPSNSDLPVSGGFPSATHGLSPPILIAAWRDSIVSVDPLTAIATVRGIDGGRPRTLELAMKEIPYKSAVDSLRNELQERESSARLEQLRDMPDAPGFPRISELLVSEEGLLWVKAFDPISDSVWLRIRRLIGGRHGGEWRVFNRTGRLVGTARLPERFIPMAVSEDRMAGVAVDGYEVETIVVYQIQ